MAQGARCKRWRNARPKGDAPKEPLEANAIKRMFRHALRKRLRLRLRAWLISANNYRVNFFLCSTLVFPTLSSQSSTSSTVFFLSCAIYLVNDVSFPVNRQILTI